MTIWALPEHIEDVLPADAASLEHMRRVALDLFATHGYELVVPPLLEYVDSLLSGVGHDMDLATFKLVDQLSGKMMGLRADTTPQVARIDSHVLNRQGVSRLCYAGSVLHTRPAGLGKSRQPFQVGAELYGYAGLEADIEVQQLMLDALAAVGAKVDKFAIGHPAIFRALLRSAGVPTADAERLAVAVSQKDVPTVTRLAESFPTITNALVALPRLYGGLEVLDRARRELPSDSAIGIALDQLARIADQFSTQVDVVIDLGELGGFNYESGVVFGAYAQRSPDAIARGGRYDGVGAAFGRARPATGFSMDLKSLLAVVPAMERRKGVLVPHDADPACRDAIRALRAAGERVVAVLPGQVLGPAELNCDRQLVAVGGNWLVVAAT